MQGLPALWAEAVGPGRRGAVPQRGRWSVPPGAGPGRGARRRAVGAPRGRRLLRKRPLCGAGAAPRRTGADRSGRAAGSALRGASEGWGRGERSGAGGGGRAQRGRRRRGGGGCVRLADSPLGRMDCSVPRHAGSCSSVVRGRSFPEPGPGPGRARREAPVAAGCERGCRR